MLPALLGGLPEKPLCYFCKNNELKLIYTLSGVQQGDFRYVCCILFFRFFSTVGFYKILNRVPCALQ